MILQLALARMGCPAHILQTIIVVQVTHVCNNTLHVERAMHFYGEEILTILRSLEFKRFSLNTAIRKNIKWILLYF